MNDGLAAVLRLRPAYDGDVHTEDEREVPEAEPEAAAGAGTSLVLSGGQVALPEQARAMAAHAWRVARRRTKDLSERKGGLIHGLLRAQPPSVDGQCTYLRDRPWVQPGHEGGLAEGTGLIFHVLIGIPGVALGDALAGLCARPFRWCAALVVILVAVLATLGVLGMYRADVMVLAGVVFMAALWAGAGLLVMRLKYPRCEETGSSEETGS